MAKSLDQWYEAGKKQGGIWGSVEDAWKAAKGKPKGTMPKENAKDAFTRGFYSSGGHSYNKNPRRVTNSKHFPAKAIIMPNGKVKVFVSPGVMAKIKRVKNPKSEYSVVVGNIGTVYDGSNKTAALKAYNTYVKQSKSMVGRAGGEEVNLMQDGEPIKTHYGSNSDW